MCKYVYIRDEAKCCHSLPYKGMDFYRAVWTSSLDCARPLDDGLFAISPAVSLISCAQAPTKQTYKLRTHSVAYSSSSLERPLLKGKTSYKIKQQIINFSIYCGGVFLK